MLVTGRAQRLITLPHLETRSDFAGYLAETYRGSYGLLATAGAGSLKAPRTMDLHLVYTQVLETSYSIEAFRSLPTSRLCSRILT